MRKVISLILLIVVCVFPTILPAYAQDDPWSKYFKAGTASDRQGRFKESIKHYSAALKEAEKSGTPDVRLVETLRMLGMAYQMVGQYGGAEQMFIRALETNLKIHAPDDDILTTFMNVARLYEWMHKPEAAIPWYEKALAFAEKAKGPEGTFVGLILAFTAEAYFKLEKYEKAEPLYLRAIAIYEKAPKPKYLNAVSILESYIKLLKKMNRKAEVKEAEKRLKAMRAK